MSERDELGADGQPGESRGDDQTTHRRDLLKAVGAGTVGLSGLANSTGRVSADQAPIEDWNDLRTLAVDPSFEILDKTLVADLDADTPGYEEHVEEPAGGWEPIDIPYINFDGNGHTISDLVINRPDESNVGLFGEFETAEIQNLSIRDADITGGTYVGTLIGYGNGIEIVNSDTTGSVSGDRNVGGFIGYMEGLEITDSYTEQQVTGGSAGGLVGSTVRGVVSNSYATGPVDGSTAGGLVGSSTEGTVRDSYATGAVSGGSAGGIVGSIGNGGTVERSYATGAVSGGDSVGGLVGSLGLGGVTNSYATNSVDGEDGVGGLVGSVTNYNDFYDFTQSYATGPVNGTENVGGLIGRFESNDGSEVTDSYWDVPASDQNESAGGTGLGSLADEPPAEEMTGENATEYMDGFDFADTWETTSSYPILAWQDPSPSVSDYADESGQVTTDGLREAVDDWRAGDIDTELLREVVDAWRSGDGIV